MDEMEMNLELLIQQVQQAQERTLSFKMELEQVLKQTQQDINSVDWQTTVPQLLTNAFAHIRFCSPTGRAIEESARQYRETVMGEQLRRTIHLLHLLQEAKISQFELQGLLIQARPVFLDEQIRQIFKNFSECNRA